MRIGSGVEGVDALVDGGLPADRLYLLSGPPGSGKTTFAVQFATRGVDEGEGCLFVSMHETGDELARSMAGYDFDFERVYHSERFHFLNVFEDESESVLVPVRNGDYRTSLRSQVRRITRFVEESGLD